MSRTFAEYVSQWQNGDVTAAIPITYNVYLNTTKAAVILNDVMTLVVQAGESKDFEAMSREGFLLKCGAGTGKLDTNEYYEVSKVARALTKAIENTGRFKQFIEAFGAELLFDPRENME